MENAVTIEKMQRLIMFASLGRSMAVSNIELRYISR